MSKQYRIGHGYDVHKLVDGRKLILGGIEIPHTLGLLGHSDADVLIHAIMDSIVGALGLGDIGKLFPDTDEQYKGISSVILLERVYDVMDKKGYMISNIDATVVAQKPRLRPFIDQMQQNIEKALHCDEGDVNIKATTEEKLGFTGREEGISAHAVCMLQKYKL